MNIHFVLAPQLLSEIIVKLRRSEIALQFVRLLEGNLVAFRNHAQKRVDSLRNLILWTRDRNHVTGLLSTWKVNLAIPFLFKIFNFGKSSDEFSVVESIDQDSLRYEFGVLDGSTGKQMRYSNVSVSPTTFSTMSMISCLTRSRL